MLIEFTKKDPRAGSRANLEPAVAAALIEAGNAKAVKEGEAVEQEAAVEVAPVAKKAATKKAK